MWKDLTYKERAEIINRWRKEHVLDYASKKAEYDNSMVNRFDLGGESNPMHYEHRGTVFSDDLKNQGITHVAELPEVKVTGRNPNSYRSSYDPLAVYNYGVKPALEGAGKAMNAALHPIDNTIDALSSPFWWVNKAITGNSDNTVQKARDWTHTAIRDAGMLLSPTRVAGTLRTGFEYAPWNPENPGITDSSEMGNAINNTLDLLAAPLGPKAAAEGFKTAVTSPRARAAVYNNITPYSYGNVNLGNYHVGKFSEMADAVKEFFTPKRIDTSGTPRWKQKWEDWVEKHPEDGQMVSQFDEDVLSANEMMDFRDYAWRKAMRQPEETPNIYIDNGDGTYSYDYELINKMRKDRGNFPFSGELSDESRFMDNITGNGGNVGIRMNPDGTITMIDTWDTQPLLGFMNRFLKSKAGRELPPFMQRGLRNIGNIDAVEYFGGDPFKHETTWDPEYFRNLPEEYFPKQ